MRFHNYIKEDQLFEEIKAILIEMSLEDAIEFATQMHQGQIRKGDKKPYVVHPKAVYSILKSFNIKDKILLVAAWLHDTIEDTKATYNIIKRKFNKDVANLVQGLSSDKKGIEKEGKEVYLLNKMLQMSNNELTLKLADRLHNVSDIMTMPEKTSDKTYRQTLYILNGLREKRSLKQIHKKIIRAIEKYLNKFNSSLPASPTHLNQD